MIGAKFSDRMPFLTSTLFFGWDPSLWCRHRPARQRFICHLNFCSKSFSVLYLSSSCSTLTYDKFFHILFEMFCKYISGFSITYICPVKRRSSLMCYKCIDNNAEIAKIKLVCASPKYCSNQKIFGVHSHYRRWHQMVGWRNKNNLLEKFSSEMEAP